MGRVWFVAAAGFCEGESLGTVRAARVRAGEVWGWLVVELG
jgi:hypothetical protein